MHNEILEDLLKDSPCTKNGLCNQGCFAREIMLSRIDDRTGEQLRLMYAYKYEQSDKEGKDIGKERAFLEFTKLYASKFGEIYKEGMKYEDLYEKVFGKKLKHTDDDIRKHIEESRKE
ncbi:hypothetical protein A3K82_00770 [Candidatus Pacearchaeota archaeon RBG_19FT_COMBO_34_9]|nr:MAG: hypothetical protein A3K82_00770 [Candidatus Pacearchaeota archaeon RBG_19FT_COMBO_34_9]OGJ16311.1 MAG: hypothetical protein A3K74_02135 [Candidatus Pacearchaeota archaeon RBG_13_33_26]